MRILCVCDEGCNRSVHIAHLLKFRGHDTIPVGVNTASPDTLAMLERWADLIIITDPEQSKRLDPRNDRMWLWPLEDGYKRPFNPQQHRQILRLIDDHRDRLITLDESAC